MVITPDLLFIVNLLSQFATNSRKIYWEAIKHTIAYFKDIINYGITYIYIYSVSLQPVEFVNSDYANDWDTQR